MKKSDTVRKQGIGMIVTLAVQYLLGMTTTIYVKFPEGKTEKQLWEFAWTQIPLAAHIIVGVLMILGGIVLIVRAILLKSKPWIIASIGGFLGVLVSSVSGALFITMQNDNYSYIMAIGFIIAFLFYAWGVYQSKK